MKLSGERLLLIIVGIAIVCGIIYAFLPRPIGVDLARVTQGPLLITVDEDGKTRIKERYVVSSPLEGRLLRIELHPGDKVEAGKTLVSSIEPAEPELLDPRVRAQAEARVKAAEAASKQALSNLERVRAAYGLVKADLDRARKLTQRGIISKQELDSAEHKERSSAEELKAAQFAVQVSRFELELAKAALLRTEPNSIRELGSWRLDIRAPITGEVLRLFQESATVISAGAQLLELGDPTDLEMEIDVLSSEAVKIKPGAKVIVDHWGGNEPLIGSVRVVEPTAFTKVSALGVEEQRVYVIADFVDPPWKLKTLGDSYRVEAHIVIWEGENVLKIPVGALFRHGDGWAVFLFANSRALLHLIKIGKRNDLEVEVLEGLKEGDLVILYPSDKIKNGVAVAPR